MSFCYGQKSYGKGLLLLVYTYKIEIIEGGKIVDYISIKEASEKCGETKGCKKKVIGAVLTERK